MNDPGKYDDLCTLVRLSAQCDTALVMVINGKHGSGFSVQTIDPALQGKLADMLETMAKEIRKQS